MNSLHITQKGVGMVRYSKTRNKKANKRTAIRHVSYRKVSKLNTSTKSITHCPKCKDGRIIKSRGLIFCGFCGHEFDK